MSCTAVTTFISFTASQGIYVFMWTVLKSRLGSFLSQHGQLLLGCPKTLFFFVQNFQCDQFLSVSDVRVWLDMVVTRLFSPYAARLLTWNIQSPVKIDPLIWSLFLSPSLSRTRSLWSCIEEESYYHISVRWPSSGPALLLLEELGSMEYGWGFDGPHPRTDQTLWLDVTWMSWPLPRLSCKLMKVILAP